RDTTLMDFFIIRTLFQWPPSKYASIFLCFDEEQTVGFAQCQLRQDYVEGTQTSPVGYLEGIYIKADYRKRGLAHRLLSACEEWAKLKGCSEFASDCELDNEDSLKFHLSTGFDEANRIICFNKKL
ncbi:MAG: GNAT family N-acetyltransferase, partial [Niameybacter sp.]